MAKRSGSAEEVVSSFGEFDQLFKTAHGATALASTNDPNRPLKVEVYGVKDERREVIDKGARVAVKTSKEGNQSEAESRYGPTASSSHFDGNVSHAAGNKCLTRSGSNGTTAMAFGRDEAMAMAKAQNGGRATAVAATSGGGGAGASGTNAVAFSYRVSKNQSVDDSPGILEKMTQWCRQNLPIMNRHSATTTMVAGSGADVPPPVEDKKSKMSGVPLPVEDKTKSKM